MLNKKRTINFAVFLLVVSIFLGGFSSFVSAQSVFCAEKTTDGAWCQNVPENEIDKNFKWAPSSCQTTTFCKVGTCVSGDSGTCTQNTPKALCEFQGNVWSAEDKDNIAECRPGCCILGQEVSFVSQAVCKSLATDYGVNINFRSDINSESSCLALDTTEDEGACVLEESITTTSGGGFFSNLFGGGNQEINTQTSIDCSRTTRSGCANLDGDFHSGLLCTAPEISDCAKDSTKTKIDEDKVYFVDTCGNLANLYDELRWNDLDYWTNIQNPSCSVEDSAASSSCGDCSYRRGTIGAEYKSGEPSMPSKKPKYGNNVCRDLSCFYDTNSDGDIDKKNEKYAHGESWCAGNPGMFFDENYIDLKGRKGRGIPISIDDETKKKISEGYNEYNLPGSESVKLNCYDGEVTPEICGDFARNSVCMEGEDPATEKRVAECFYNPAADCFSNYADRESCEDKDYCKWVPGYAQGGLFIGYGMEELEKELDKSYENNIGRYNDLQGTCMPLFTPGSEFWTDQNDCSDIGSITENVLFETGTTEQRENFAKEDTKHASNRCIDNCWAIPGYGSTDGKTYEDIETLKEFQLSDKSLDTKVQNAYLSKREGYYCKKDEKESDVIDNWKAGAEKGDSINCGGDKDLEKRRVKQFYTHEQWLDSISERTRSLGDCGYKPHAYSGKISGFTYDGDTNSEKISVSFEILKQSQEVKEIVGEKKTLYTGKEINMRTPLNVGYRDIASIFYS